MPAPTITDIYLNAALAVAADIRDSVKRELNIEHPEATSGYPESDILFRNRVTCVTQLFCAYMANSK